MAGAVHRAGIPRISDSGSEDQRFRIRGSAIQDSMIRDSRIRD
jgi:hypothetical protein